MKKQKEVLAERATVDTNSENRNTGDRPLLFSDGGEKGREEPEKPPEAVRMRGGNTGVALKRDAGGRRNAELDAVGISGEEYRDKPREIRVVPDEEAVFVADRDLGSHRHRVGVWSDSVQLFQRVRQVGGLPEKLGGLVSAPERAVFNGGNTGKDGGIYSPGERLNLFASGLREGVEVVIGICSVCFAMSQKEEVHE
jgi:hypothetical protein